jgi:hypothetical protein
VSRSWGSLVALTLHYALIPAEDILRHGKNHGVFSGRIMYWSIVESWSRGDVEKWSEVKGASRSQ